MLLGVLKQLPEITASSIIFEFLLCSRGVSLLTVENSEWSNKAGRTIWIFTGQSTPSQTVEQILMENIPKHRKDMKTRENN